jgi:peptide/nickel transport system substrate-binding protein
MQMTKIDDYTIRYDFAVPYPAILYVYSHYQGSQYSFAPSHYLKQFHADYAGEETVEKMAKDAGYDQWVQLFGNANRVCSCMPCGEGLPSFSPYVLKTTSPDLHVLERNPYYWKIDPEGQQLPYIDRVRLFIYQDAEVLALKAIQGEFSIFAQHAKLADYPIYQDNKEKGGYELYRWVDGIANKIAFQFNLTSKDPVKREVFRDKRFRIAFSHSLNRDEINEVRFFGLCQPMAATAHPRSPYYKEEYANAYIEYDPEKANRLLDEMGLTERDSEGYRLLPDGRRFELTLEYPPGNHSWMPPIAELTTEYLADIGIQMHEKTDDRSLRGQRVANNEVDFSEWGAPGFTNTMITDPRAFVPFRLGDETIWYQLWSEWYASGGERGEEPIPEVQKLLDWYEEAISTVGEDARNAVIDKILKSQAENLWLIGVIGNMVQPVLVDADLANVPKEGVHSYDTIRMQPNHPEQFFFKDR